MSGADPGFRKRGSKVMYEAPRRGGGVVNVVRRILDKILEIV